jgi:hypothetical protein
MTAKLYIFIYGKIDARYRYGRVVVAANSLDEAKQGLIGWDEVVFAGTADFVTLRPCQSYLSEVGDFEPKGAGSDAVE